MSGITLQKLALTVVATSLSLAAIKTEIAAASTITYDFLVETERGDYKGYFSYDDTAPSPAGVQPYYEITDFSFDFIDTNYQNLYAPRTYTQSDLRTDGRTWPRSLPLTITNGEVIIDPENTGIYSIPRGGTLERFSFSTFNSFDFDGRGEANGWWTLGNSGFYYMNGWDRTTGPNPNSGGDGIVSYWLRTSASVPEPSTILGLSLVGLGWLFSKKKTAPTND
ncbi:PEP-CTERM sorting domain-containing protein [Ancylothrix sp. C2]|uniref:PEP-CTERM sorting domain-containing protein n=1 Tax=Ancylothrix sp. D3o TaxID=2953691 RepID=UPI0021BB6B97|nr:PEP-CTERM sorting domain-containing protein [Ancylothrix sp. D3o]MCT7948931.1 PEP-CTERM sorting domain-containing protein [Ancylothrix sp. D3o]